MKRLFRRLARHRSALLMTFFRLLTYTCLVALFFGLMSIHNWYLLHPSRTLATTLLTFFTMLVVMNAVYGGYAVGKKKSKPVISSMSLSIIATDLISYLQLQIMNVNENNNDHLVLFGPDFPLLLLCIVLQIAVIIFWVWLGNNMYFSINPPQRCLLVLGHECERTYLLRKLDVYRLQWQITSTLLYDDPHLEEQLAQVDTVIVGGVPEDRRNGLLLTCYAHQKNVLCHAALEDIMVSNGKQTIVDDAPFLEIPAAHMTLNQRIIKRLMDLTVSGLGLVLFSPIMALIALAIHLEDRGPVIFRQQRVTLRGRIFTIYKFRTMRMQDENAPEQHFIALAIHLEDRGPVIFRQQRVTLRGRIFTIYKFRTMRMQDENAPEQHSAAKDDPRITRVGRLLRRTRLDELPQLVNIFRGDMTLVGPRPEMVENVTRYKAELPDFVYREKMKAGLTGYAQIEGKYNTSPEDKLMLDLMYIESFSIWLDIKLLFRTLTVFFRSDSTEGFDAADTDASDPPDSSQHDLPA